MRNEDEGFEDWDADFLDQLIQVEEFALSSTSNNPIPSSSSTFPPPPFQPEPQHLVEVFHERPISYSPPRELSQRATASRSHAVRSPNGLGECGPSSSALAPCLPRPDAAKELEICNLKVSLSVCGYRHRIHYVNLWSHGFSRKCLEFRTRFWIAELRFLCSFLLKMSAKCGVFFYRKEGDVPGLV